MQPNSRLILLGGFDLALPDVPEQPALARKAKALLAFLALNPGRAQPRDKLATLLWEESGQTQARHSLRQALAGLRKALPRDGALVTDNDSVTLGRLEVDALAFERLAAGKDPAEIERAVALYGGDLLEGFNARSDAFEEWLLAQRSQFRELAVTAMARLLDMRLAGDGGESAVRLAHRLIALDPLRESAHRALMGLYARLGRSPDAVRQYRHLRRLLWRELDVEPEPETVRLHEQIMAGRADRRFSGAERETPPAESPAESDADASSSRPRSGTAAPELRQVTVLALTWVPPGQLMDGDPEALRDLAARFQAQLADTTQRFKGEVLQSGQDGALIAFGLSRARSDDPERALRAALGVRDALAENSSGSLRAALDCGQALCEEGQAEPYLSGPVLHRCSDLLRLAADGEVLATDALHRRVRGWVEAEPLDSTPEAAWRVTSLVQTPGAPVTRLIGRRHELGLLVSTLSACADSGTGNNFLIRGEAGIGKTRLVEEARRRASELGFTPDVTRILDFGATPGQDPIAGLVMGLLSQPSEASPAEIETAMQRAGGLRHLERGVLTLLRPTLGLSEPSVGIASEPMPEQARKQGLRDAVTGLLRGSADEQPRLLIVEDIHWADPGTLSLLAAVAETTPLCAAVLIMTSRVEGEPLDPEWRAAMHGAPLTTLDLGPLQPEQALALAHELAPEDEARARLCTDRAEGNPLFLEQLLLSSDGGVEGVPDSVQSIVLARVDALPGEERNALQAASILGQRFGLDCLRALIRDPGYDGKQSLQRRLLRPDGPGLAFAHALIRDAVYGSLTASRRRLLHREAADWYREPDPVLHARHLAKSGAEEAAQAHVRAARHLLRAFRYDQAAALVQEGLALTRDPAMLYDLHQLAGEALFRSGRMRKGRSHFETALDLAQGDPERARTLLGLARVQSTLDEPEPALKSLELATTAAAAAGDAALEADIRFQRGNVLFNLARLDDCLSSHRQLADYAKRSGSARHEALAEGGLGDAFYLRGRMITAHGHFSRCVELARSHELTRLIPANLAMQAWTAFFCNRLPEGIAQLEEARRIAREIYDPYGEGVVYGALGPMLLYRGDVEYAREISEQALELAHRIGSPRFEADSLWALGEAYGVAGDRSQAVRLQGEALQVLGDVGIPYAGAVVLGVLARFTTDKTERRACIAEGERFLTKETISHNFLQFHQNAIEAWLEEGDWDKVEYHAGALSNYTREEPLPWARFYIARGRALAAAGRGRRDDALAQELSELIEEGREAQLNTALPDLEHALDRLRM